MKAAMFASTRYVEPYRPGWPAPTAAGYSDAVAERSYQHSLELFGLADQLGFDWVTVAEHHYSGFSMTPNPMVMAGVLCKAVKNARIAVLGPNIPTLNPVRVAEEFAMLDVISGGRVVAGMLRGTANEYVTYGTNPAESRARFEEALQLIKAAWTETQPFGWQGRHFEYRTISIWPRPVQKPHPPIYISGSSPESASFAARNRLGVAFAVTTRALAARSARQYCAEAQAAGWQPGADDILYRVAVHVAETDEQAFADLGGPEAIAQPNLRMNRAIDQAVAETGYHGQDAQAQRARHYRGAPLREQIENAQILCGSPQSVVDQIRRVREEIGAGVLDLIFRGASHERTLRSVELFGRRVLPCLREL
jgi:alkanesulfonate monooxygenase SsuD/methylene tetrahydromethanopterin reductase-like flavin-dependent oxidoreductase (luciferase family)